jgi:hypothetical protein
MKKLLLALVLPLCSLALASAQEGVDTQELKSGAKKVEFVNFTGTHTVIETAEQIRGIGRGLASGVSAGAVPARWLTKYSVFHVPSVSGQKAFGADIFTIDPESRIDHINNVRRIVSAYLEQLYGYPRRDADVLALFVSYYNAVNRGDLAYFAGRYLPAVASRLDAAKVGISTKYFEWPGATQLVVPISAVAGRDILGALDASELTSAAVTDLLKAREDKGVAERTAAADLKAREAEAAKKALEDEKARLEAQRKVTADQEAAAKAAQAEADRLKAAGSAEAAKAAEEAKRQADELAARQVEEKAAAEKLAAEQQAVADREKELAAEKAQLEKDKAAIEAAKTPEEKAAELAAREAEVAQREEAVRKGATEEDIYGGKLYYLKIEEYLSGGHYNNDMLIIDAATGKLLLKSEESNICGRKFDLSKSGIVVIVHKEGGHELGHYLELLDLDDLSRKAIGEDMIFYRSFVEIREDFIYAIINAPDGYYLGKFNVDMKRVAISKDRVDGDSFISFYNDLVYINREDKQILVLNRDDLSTKNVINP